MALNLGGKSPIKRLIIYFRALPACPPIGKGDCEKIWNGRRFKGVLKSTATKSHLEVL
jgi:hypothetical protein